MKNVREEFIGEDCGFEADRVKITLGILISTIIAYMYWGYTIKVNPSGILGVATLGNIKTYCVFCSIFSISIIVTSFLLKKYKVSFKFSGTIISCFIFFVATTFLIFDSTNAVGKKYAIMIVGVSVIALVLIKIASPFDKLLLLKIVSYMMVLICILLWYRLMSPANTIGQIGIDEAEITGMYNAHHSAAYIDTIYATVNGVPFAKTGLSHQYGYYSLLYAIPLKIIGVNMFTVSNCIAIAGVIGLAFLYESVNIIIKNKTYANIAFLIVTCFGMRALGEAIYWQNYPHRLIFPFVFIFLITYSAHYGINRREIIIGTLVLAVAFLWNFESAVICCLAWSFFLWTQSEGNVVKKTVVICLNDILAFVLAFGCVNVYNWKNGGDVITVKNFFVGENLQEYIKELETPLEFYSIEYTLKLMVFLIALAIILFHIINKRKLDGIGGFLLSNSVMGLGLLVYYMNRTRAGSKLVDFFYAGCLIGLTAYFWKCKKERNTRVKSDYLLIYVLTLSIVYTVSVSLLCVDSINLKLKSNIYNYDEYLEFVEDIEPYISEDTYGFGNGVSGLLMTMGKGHISNMFADFAAEDLKQNKDCEYLITSSNYFFNVFDQFRLQNEFVYNDYKVGIFKRIDFSEYVSENSSIKGAGTESDPFIIKDADDLAFIRDSVNRAYSFDGCYLKQNNDIDLSEIENWQSIGLYNSGYYFEGIYDGNGYKITGMNCIHEGENTGLFGQLGGVVANLAVEDSYIKGLNAGGICSRASCEDALIINCYTDCVIDAEGAGGITDDFIGVVENCVSTSKKSDFEKIEAISCDAREMKDIFSYLYGSDIDSKCVEQLDENVRSYNEADNMIKLKEWKKQHNGVTFRHYD